MPFLTPDFDYGFIRLPDTTVSRVGYHKKKMYRVRYIVVFAKDRGTYHGIPQTKNFLTFLAVIRHIFQLNSYYYCNGNSYDEIKYRHVDLYTVVLCIMTRMDAD
jgi:hypothetical protein